MKLQTSINLNPNPNNQITYNSSILSTGSCFVENIGAKLAYYKFKSEVNPFGILFNPVAIENFLTRAVDVREYSKDEMFFLNEQWHCSDAHSELNSESAEEILNTLNSQLKKTNTKLKNATHLIITLGTAWVYRDLDTNNIVANCHKRPQYEFKKELLSVEDIANSISNSIGSINSLNPNVQVILTVSPVRHLKDGFQENTLSKAQLISAVHQTVNKNSQISYFPSYEIMIDELRDYRFYERDMLHPSQMAIDYIWERFKLVWIASDADKTMKKVEQVQKSLQHKPFNPNSDSHRQFLQKISDLKNRLNKDFPHIVF